MLRQTFLTLSNSRELQDVALHNGVARRVALRFVAGETLEQAGRAVAELNRAGIAASIDHLGENVTRPEEARAAAASYLVALDFINASGLNCNVSLKLTQMGVDLDEALCLQNVSSIVERAAKYDSFVRIDMESSAYTDRTLDFFRKLWVDRGLRNLGVVLQSYLYRTEEDVREMNRLGVRVRLCKGAYNEPADVAFPRKADVDASYAKCARLLLRDGVYPGLATHDLHLINHLKRFAAAQGIDSAKYEFQMLYGIRRDMQLELVRQGYNMRVYVPYGSEWYPYFMRRMAERPANVVFIAGNFFRR